MNYTLIIQAPPNHSANRSAFLFAKALLNRGHTLNKLFFYGEGAFNASSTFTPAQDEVNWHQQWQQLAEAHQLSLQVCIAAGLRRGLLNEEEANRHEKTQITLEAPFELVGLGQLVDGIQNSDKVISFGG